MTRIVRVEPTGITEAEDTLAVEEPLEIRVAEKPLSVTMRTPGDDFELAAGFLWTEGIVRERRDIAGLRHWGSPNVVRVALRDDLHLDLQKLQRHFFASSSCGVCGKATIDALRTQTTALPSRADVSREVVTALPDRLRAAQTNFDATGGLHAAGLFDRDGTLLCVREDIGRHNAVDKVIGSFFLEERPLDDTILVVSGRAGFEIVQKAIVARIPVLAAVGAPSSLAVDLAREMNLTLLGFVRDGRYNVYNPPASK